MGIVPWERLIPNFSKIADRHIVVLYAHPMVRRECFMSVKSLLKSLHKFWYMVKTVVGDLLTQVPSDVPKVWNMISKESCPGLLHWRLGLQYYDATCTFSCNSWPIPLKQLVMRPHQGNGPWKSCYWILSPAKLILIPLQDWLQHRLQDSAKKLPAKHLILRICSCLCGPLLLCLNQGCSYLCVVVSLTTCSSLVRILSTG